MGLKMINSAKYYKLNWKNKLSFSIACIILIYIGVTTDFNPISIRTVFLVYIPMAVIVVFFVLKIEVDETRMNVLFARIKIFSFDISDLDKTFNEDQIVLSRKNGEVFWNSENNFTID